MHCYLLKLYDIIHFFNHEKGRINIDIQFIKKITEPNDFNIMGSVLFFKAEQEIVL